MGSLHLNFIIDEGQLIQHDDANQLTQLKPVEEITINQLDALPNIRFDADSEGHVLLWIMIAFSVLVALMVAFVYLKRPKILCDKLVCKTDDVKDTEPKTVDSAADNESCVTHGTKTHAETCFGMY